jgi:hypothetical protein
MYRRVTHQRDRPLLACLTRDGRDARARSKGRIVALQKRACGLRQENGGNNRTDAWQREHDVDVACAWWHVVVGRRGLEFGKDLFDSTVCALALGDGGPEMKKLRLNRT